MKDDCLVTDKDEKVAIIFRGLSFKPRYRHQSGFSYSVDFRKCASNLVENLSVLKSDIFISTNSHPFESEVIKIFKPVACNFEKNVSQSQNSYQAIATHIRRCFAQIRETGKIYDKIIVSRFDIYLDGLVSKLPIDNNKFNFICYAENNNLIDDNLWIFPFKMMEEVDSLLAQVISGKNLKTHEIVQFLKPETYKPLFEGNFIIMKARPYIKFQREISKVALIRRAIIQLHFLGIKDPAYIITVIKRKTALPRREIAWRFYAILDFIFNLLKVKIKHNKIHFVTFYSEGSPFDKGLDVRRSCKRLVKSLRPFVDSVRAYSVRELRNDPSTSVYVKEFDEVAEYNAGTNKIGFLRWKPYIILKTMHSCPVRSGA